MQNEMFFDPDKPLLIIKVGTKYLTQETSEYIIYKLKNNIKTDEKSNIWILTTPGSDDINVQVVWGGKYNKFDNSETIEKISNLFNNNTEYEYIKDSDLTDDEKTKFLKLLRNYRINKIINSDDT
jgi:hypothetical protein